ncbi:phage tail tape measure protein, partial [Nonomuraea sp. NPDC050733]
LLTAQLGLTAKEADRIGKVAGDLFASGFGESMEDVNGALQSVVQNMDGMKGASASALKDTAGRALNVAKIMGEDVSKVTASVSTLMKTGLAPNAKAAFDVILRGTQLGANKQQDLLDTLTEYPTLFRNMGLDAQTATGLLVQGLQAGARDSDKVADAIKEFSIRAVDGSKLTSQGFQMIGLDAGKMAAAIGKGGSSANTALDLTLTKLRAIEDPVKRSQAAVALFGTQAEDLGQALFALDPSGAAKKLDGFKGSVDRAGNALQQTAGAKLEAFKRQLIGAFTETLGNTVIPAIQRFISLLQGMGVSPTALIATAAAITGLALAVKAASLAVTIYNGLAAASAAASKVWAAGVWLVNAAMRANPIGIVITVIMALVAAVVLAYNKSETFRNIVQAAWRGIQAAVAFAWENIIKPAFLALHRFITGTLGPAVMWLWNNIIKPAWKGISFAVEVAWGIIKIIFAAFEMFLRRVVAPVVTWLWKTIIVPAWNGIKAAISVVWNSGIKPVFENVKKGVELVGKAFESAKNFIGKVWDKVRDLAMKPIRFVVETVYTKGIKGVWDKVAKFVGADPLPAAPRFATGGPVRQGTTSKADDVLARVSRGEFVVNAASTRRNAGLIDYVNRHGKNKDVIREMGLAGDPGGIVPGFAEGGIIGWVKGWATKAKTWFEGGLAKALDGVIGPINGLIDRTLGTAGLGGLIGGVPKKALANIRSWLMARKDQLEGGGGQGAVKAARSQIGVPYSWGGGGLNGPSRGIEQGSNIVGFDCSSLMRYAWYQATHKVMPRTTYEQYPWLTKVSSPRPGDLGFPHMGHVFMQSDNPNRIIEAPYTGARVREVPKRAAKWGRPPASFMRADDGTAVLEPGMNGVYNGLGRREPLVDPALAGGTVIRELHVHVPLGADEVQMGRTVLKAIQAAVRRDGKAGVKAILP